MILINQSHYGLDIRCATVSQSLFMDTTTRITVNWILSQICLSSLIKAAVFRCKIDQSKWMFNPEHVQRFAVFTQNQFIQKPFLHWHPFKTPSGLQPCITFEVRSTLASLTFVAAAKRSVFFAEFRTRSPQKTEVTEPRTFKVFNIYLIFQTLQLLQTAWSWQMLSSLSFV